jgi:hypothetical protein
MMAQVHIFRLEKNKTYGLKCNVYTLLTVLFQMTFPNLGIDFLLLVVLHWVSAMGLQQFHVSLFPWGGRG